MSPQHLHVRTDGQKVPKVSLGDVFGDAVLVRIPFLGLLDVLGHKCPALVFVEVAAMTVGGVVLGQIVHLVMLVQVEFHCSIAAATQLSVDLAPSAEDPYLFRDTLVSDRHYAVLVRVMFTPLCHQDLLYLFQEIPSREAEVEQDIFGKLKSHLFILQFFFVVRVQMEMGSFLSPLHPYPIVGLHVFHEPRAVFTAPPMHCSRSEMGYSQLELH